MPQQPCANLCLLGCLMSNIRMTPEYRGGLGAGLSMRFRKPLRSIVAWPMSSSYWWEGIWGDMMSTSSWRRDLLLMPRTLRISWKELNCGGESLESQSATPELTLRSGTIFSLRERIDGCCGSKEEWGLLSVIRLYLVFLFPFTCFVCFYLFFCFLLCVWEEMEKWSERHQRRNGGIHDFAHIVLCFSVFGFA